MKKDYDLEDRTLAFARNCRCFIRSLKSDFITEQDGKQLVRSSGSVASNYIEANESLGTKDFLFRLKISRKEAKESRLWLSLITTDRSDLDNTRLDLLSEADQLRKILSSIISKFE